MRNSQHLVSFRTYALAFAVALSPALMQMGGRGDGGPDFSCTKTGDTRLSELAVIVNGEDQIAFDSSQRAYGDIWLPASADSALISAIPVDLDARVWVRVYSDFGTVETMAGVYGGGQAVTPLEPGPNTIEVGVRAPGGAGGYYTVDVSVGCSECSDGDACTIDTCDFPLEMCVHAVAPLGSACDFGGGIPGVCANAGGGRTYCASACSAAECAEDYNECTIDTCDPVVGCYTPVPDGTPCDGGTCQSGACALGGTVLPCTEQGIRNAIAASGGPYTFDCVGPTTVLTVATIVIDNDVILDGEGLFTVDGDFSVNRFVTAELLGFTVTGPITNLGTLAVNNSTVPGGISNGAGALTVTGSTVSWIGNTDGATTVTNTVVGGIYNSYDGVMTMMTSTVSGNEVGIENRGTLTLTNSTVSGNATYGLRSWGAVYVRHSTISGTISIYLQMGDLGNSGGIDIAASLVDGACSQWGDPAWIDNGYNIESPGDTCGFDQPTDQVNVTTAQLNLGPLQNNGGPTETHALLPGSVAIDWIPEAMCLVSEDQRGVTRPQGVACDVGAFELEQ